jgi:hypothetical protein
MKYFIFLIAIVSATFSGGCTMNLGGGDSNIVTEIPSAAEDKTALGPEAVLCLESAGHWNIKDQHCLVTEKLCGQVGDWIGKSCAIPVTDCIEEGSRKEGSKCVIEFYSKAHMQTLVAATKS